MKSNKPFTTILVISLSLAIIGFIIDLHERVPNIWINIKDIVVMTFMLFIILSAIWLSIQGIKSIWIKFF